jgi:uncharacterized protein YqjF (DUF2071 family)
VRLPYTPAIPYISELNELNLRTYVSVDGVPGVWFFSLDANHLLAVWAANMLFSLPYFYADIVVEHSDNGRISFSCDRRNERKSFEARWKSMESYSAAKVDTVEHFLVERYCLYTESGGKLYWARIRHPSWRLSPLSSLEIDTDLLNEFGLSQVASKAEIAHAADTVTVDIWPLEIAST